MQPKQIAILTSSLLGLTLAVTGCSTANSQTIDPTHRMVNHNGDRPMGAKMHHWGDKMKGGMMGHSMGGMAELSGFDVTLNPQRRATLEMVTQDLFAGGDLPNASFWTGLRPMTPDSTPIIGATRYRNLFLNTGHGTLGWTMACGSGKLISDLVLGKTPDIRIDGLSLQRYS